MSRRNQTIEYKVRANTSAVTLSMHQGVIKIMKIHNKKYLMHLNISALDDYCSASERTKNISFLHAIEWITEFFWQMSVKKIFFKESHICNSFLRN